VLKTFRDFIIADQSTEPHSPWQKPAELNGVKYLNSHAQVPLGRTGAPDNQWFLAQDYLAHVHNLSENLQLNWKLTQHESTGGTPDISHILMFDWFESVLYWIQSQNFNIQKPQKGMDTL
jgi:hypothetical protein